MTQSVDHLTDPTRARLLEAAGEEFAAFGFHGATIRRICERAEANIAAVNYHFGDKEALYRAVFAYFIDMSNEKYPPLLGVAEDASAPERLHAVVRSTLHRLLDEGRPVWVWRLLLHELAEPSAALDDLCERLARPIFVQLQRVVSDVLGPTADDITVRVCVGSVIAQCLFYRHSQPMIVRLNPHLRFDAEAIAGLAAHITRFSLDALAARRTALEAGVPAGGARPAAAAAEADRPAIGAADGRGTRTGGRP